MTFGEKLKQARKEAGLTQEQLALKLGVSRSAVAKWETDKGLPDVSHFKTIAWALGVSVDCLLDEGTALDLSVTREPIDLTKYGKGIRKKRKDRLMRERFPDAEILTLLPKEKLTKGERLVDTAIWLLSCLPPGTLEIAKGLNHLDKEFYLVNQGERQYLVLVTDEFLECRALAVPVREERFELGNFQFVSCGPIRYA